MSEPNARDRLPAAGSPSGGSAADAGAGAASISDGPAGEALWDARAVRSLRHHLGASQSDLADRLGTRQQTVSEWERGASRPRRMSRRLLHLVAEASGYYRARADGDAADVPTDPGAADVAPSGGAHAP